MIGQGVLPILPTPFYRDESIDFSQYAKLIDFSIKSGATGLGVPAYGSECYKLSDSERIEILDTVIALAKGRVPVVAQCNHVSPHLAAELAYDAQERGADIISAAIPRAFPSSSRHSFEYCKAVCDRVSVPVIVQDWNPGGSTIGLEFATQLYQACPNFKFIKYEEPGNGQLMRQIHVATEGNVQVLSGWGGSYMIELIPAGLFGIIPGISMLDHFTRIWNAASKGFVVQAHDLFAEISPLLQFSLRNIEVFHHVEKQILNRRGLLSDATVRSVTIEFDPYQKRYLEALIDRLCYILEVNEASTVSN